MARTKKQTRSKPVTRLAKMMRGIDFCMMTTHGGRAGLRSRPMSNNGEVDFDGDCYFFSSKKSRKVKDIASDPQVILTYAGGSKTSPVWIAVTGKAVLIDDVEQKQDYWLDELERWFEDGPADPDVVLIHVKAKHAAWWSYKDEGELAL
jgi:general stress protein 26